MPKPEDESWERASQLELRAGELVALWNRSIEAAGIDLLLCVVTKSGTLKAIYRGTEYDGKAASAMVKRIGWFREAEPTTWTDDEAKDAEIERQAALIEKLVARLEEVESAGAGETNVRVEKQFPMTDLALANFIQRMTPCEPEVDLRQDGV